MSPQARRSAAPGLGLLRGAARGDVDTFLARTNPRILLIKTHDQLGDFLVATPAIAALRARFPQGRIELVTREYLAPLARRQPALDVVHVLSSVKGMGGILAALRLAPTLRTGPPDLALVLNSVSRSRTADLIAALSGARLVVGRSRVGPGAPDPAREGGGRDALYDLDLDVAPASAHQVDRLLDLVRWAVAEARPAPGMTLGVSAAERAQGRAALARAFAEPAPAGPRVGLHPAAANALKCWPVDSFVELGARLAGAGAALAVFDTPKESGPARALVDGLARRGVRAGLVPAGPLDEFIVATSALDLMVCNDSGVMHVAAALDVPTLSFHSLGRPEEWAPRSETAIALHAEPIAGIPVDDAERAARRLLKSPS